MTSTVDHEIEAYVAAVAAALADLPADEREELLDDLPQHLSDVRADGGAPLAELIGAPDDYAAELRSTAGLAAASPPPAPWWHGLRARLDRADVRVGSALGYDRSVDLIRALKPAWWLVRAYLVVEALSGATGRQGWHALVPQFTGSSAVGIVVLLAACVASVWWGRREKGSVWPRAASAALGLALAVFAVVLAHHVVASSSTVSYIDNGDVSDITDNGTSNIYPVGPDGTVLHGIRLYDQDGNPLNVEPGCANSDGSGVGDSVDGSAGESTDGGDASVIDPAITYPVTCPSDAGPFPSGKAPVLPSTAASGVAPATSVAPAAPAATPSASAPVSTPTPSTPTARSTSTPAAARRTG